MTDRIVLSGIELFAHGGVSAAEREVGQRYRISLEIEYDLAAAAETDDIADTIHYGMVHTLVVDVLRERPFRLLESAAGRIADRILQEFGCDRVVVRLEKLLPPVDGVIGSAGVELTRSAGERRGPQLLRNRNPLR